MASKQDWLDAGLEILAERGAPALTVDELTRRLELSKGSFYHHFRGSGGFKSALLAHFEALSTTRYIDLVESDPDAPPMIKLRRLLDQALTEDGGPDVEVAVRAWALQDAEARHTQARVDRTRMDYVRALGEEACGDAEEAELRGRLLYLVVIGASQVIPPVPPDELRRLCERLLLRLSPAQT